MFLEFVKHIDVDVRPAWYNAETQAEQYRSDMARSERQRGKDAGLVKNIRFVYFWCEKVAKKAEKQAQHAWKFL